MLLVIHNLPNNIKYTDIKFLIQTKCGLSEVILDNLVSEGQTKRVTVGLADDGDAAILVRKINGLYLGGQQLYVEDVRQKTESEQPYRTSKNILAQSNIYDPFSTSAYPGDDVAEVQGNQDNLLIQNQDPMSMMMNYNSMTAIGGMYTPYMPTMPSMPQAQNSFMGYGGQQQVASRMPQPPEVQAQPDRPFTFGRERAEEIVRDWDLDKKRRPDNRQRQSYGERRAPSPSYGNGSDAYNGRPTRWNEAQPVAKGGGRQNRSPPRGQWNTRDRADNRQDNFADYYDDTEPLNNAPQGYNQAPESFDHSNNYRSNLGNPKSLHPTQSANVFGDHAMQKSAPRWEPRNYNENRFDVSDSLQPYRGRKDAPVPRGGKNFPPRDSSKPFESRNWYSGGPGPSGQAGNRRDESRFPPKRGNRRDNDEPQSKRFAPPREVPRGNNWRGAAPQKPPQRQVVAKGPPNAPRDRKLDTGKNPNNPPDTMEKLLNKDDTWRGQAASSLAKQILKDLTIDLLPSDKIFTHLKQSIRARINVMLGDKIANPTNQIIEIYTSKFPSSGNQQFFNTVVNSLKEQEANDSKQRPGGPGSNQPRSADAKPARVPASKPAKKPAPKAAVQPPTKTGLLPRFPEGGDKQMYKKVKADDKKEWGCLDNYVLPDDEKKALEEEIDTLCDVFMGECTGDTAHEKIVCEQISDIVSDVFTKVVRVHVSKRLLKNAKNLIARVHTAFRSPPREALEKYLITFGCVALQKSDRHGQLHMAFFDDYDNYDKLIAASTAEIEGIPLSFKPFQICGPPPSAAIVRQQYLDKKNKFIESQKDKSKENILQPGYIYEYKPANDGKTNVQTTEQNDEQDNSGPEDGDNIGDEAVNESENDQNGNNAGDDDVVVVKSELDTEEICDDVDEDDLEDY